MANLLLRFCKKYHQYSNKKIADALGVSIRQYIKIENGETLLTHQQARQLGKLYCMKGSCFYEAARQLDLLQRMDLIIKILKSQNERMEAMLKNGPPTQSLHLRKNNLKNQSST